MKKRASLWVAIAACGLMLAAGCSSDTDKAKSNGSSSHAEMGDMDHDSSGAVPEGLHKAADPAYPVGTPVTLHSDHMPGMNGASGVVTGVYDTIAYSVSYTPTNGGEPVSDHKWVVREELQSRNGAAPKVGDKVILEADHMEGMKGAEATIDTMKEGAVYMLDYTPTEGGETVKNHRWMTEDELSAK